MNAKLTLVILVLALGAALFSLFGTNSVGNLRALRKTLDESRVVNDRMGNYVNSLKKEINDLSNNPRALEKAARDELGLARPNEKIFFFERSKGEREPNRE